MDLRYNAGEVVTAMITPFDENLNIDYAAVEKLVNHLIETGSDAVLIAGTTGESPTLSCEEELELFKFVKKIAAGRVKLIAGAGSNSTETAVKTARNMESLGADAILSVVPYYNKPSQAGMIAHFSAIAEAVKLPIILYNIKSRTGVNMEPETVAFLAKKYENIVAIKQSNPDLDLVTEMKKLCSEDFAIYCGDDSLTLPMLSIGAFGVISVASHVIGNEIKKMITEFKSGNVGHALEIHLKYADVFKTLFMCPNPVPVKEALFKLGISGRKVRLPLVEMNEDERSAFYKKMSSYIE